MYKVSEEDRKLFLEYLAKKPYIEVAALVLTFNVVKLLIEASILFSTAPKEDLNKDD